MVKDQSIFHPSCGLWCNWVFIWGGGGARPLSVGGGGGLEDGIAMIYCAQSKVKLQGGGGNGGVLGVSGGTMASQTPSP